jgi:hypothetical protein
LTCFRLDISPLIFSRYSVVKVLYKKAA